MFPLAWTTAAAPVKPNIVIIIVDDLRASLKETYNDSLAITPNMDALAKRGIAFSNHHVQISECAPSRVSFMTGLRPDQILQYSREGSFRRKNPTVRTMGAHFRSLGYTSVSLGKTIDKTSINGKSDNAVDPCPAGSPLTDTKCSFDYEGTSNFLANDPTICLPKTDQFPGSGPNRKFAMYGYNKNGTDANLWLDSCLAMGVVKKLQEFEQKPNQPFFMIVGFSRPHLPWSAPFEYWQKYPMLGSVFAKEVYKLDISSPTFFSTQSSAASKRVKYDEINMWEKGSISFPPTDRTKGYYTCIAFADAQVGVVVRAIQESKYDHVRNNTIIVLWGDNGLHIGPVLWGKKTLFEQATRTPLIFVPSETWKAQHKNTTWGKISDQPVESVDIYPTLLDLVNASPVWTPSVSTPLLAGVSLTPLFFNQSQMVKLGAISQYRNQAKFKDLNSMGYSLRTKHYRMIQYYKFDPKCFAMEGGCRFFQTLSNVKQELYYYPRPGFPEAVNVFTDKNHDMAKTVLLTIMSLKSEDWSALTSLMGTLKPYWNYL